MGYFSNTHRVVAAAPEQFGEALGAIELVLFQGAFSAGHGSIVRAQAQTGRRPVSKA